MLYTTQFDLRNAASLRQLADEIYRQAEELCPVSAQVKSDPHRPAVNVQFITVRPGWLSWCANLLCRRTTYQQYTCTPSPQGMQKTPEKTRARQNLFMGLVALPILALIAGLFFKASSEQSLILERVSTFESATWGEQDAQLPIAEVHRMAVLYRQMVELGAQKSRRYFGTSLVALCGSALLIAGGGLRSPIHATMGKVALYVALVLGCAVAGVHWKDGEKKRELCGAINTAHQRAYPLTPSAPTF
jgi:hypothetical protein